MRANVWSGRNTVQVENVPDPKILGEDPALQVQEDLRRLKQLMETGEIPTTGGQPTGRRSERKQSAGGAKRTFASSTCRIRRFSIRTTRSCA